MSLEKTTYSSASEPNGSTGSNDTSMTEYQFPRVYDHHQSPVAFNPCYMFKYRCFIVVTAVLVTVIGEVLTIPTDQIECINDPVHQLTQPINNLINQNYIFAAGLQITSSLILDVSFISISVYWLLYTRTFRFYFALLTFYGIRFLHLQLLQLRFAPGYYWADPGVPSLVVKYGWLSDFFYSGHCGFLFLCSQEWRRVGQLKASYLLLLASLFQAFVVISFRIHYTIDVPGGFVYSNWIYRLTCDYEIQIDYYNKKFIDWVMRIFGRTSLEPKSLNNEVELKVKNTSSLPEPSE